MKDKKKFVHLRVRSSFSLLKSTNKISDLSKFALDNKQPAIAITDIFNLFGAYEFSQEMIENGIQPIIGVEISVQDKYGTGEIVLIVKNKQGYKNLSSLITNSLMKIDNNNSPFVMIEDLEQKAEGLILLSGGIKFGYIGVPAAKNNYEILNYRTNKLKNIFKDRFYLEIQRIGLPEEDNFEKNLFDLAKKT